jgi:selenide,water dikinase
LEPPNPAGVEVLVGPQTADDAGVFTLPGGQLIAQTIDYFPPVVDDPYDWGRITAANAVSDIYAMGGVPLTALQLIGWPRGELSLDLLGEVIDGGQVALAEAGCVIVGGHSIDDQEPKYGFAITGLVEPGRLVTNAGAQPGDVLVLTKPLGTGIISTAIKTDRAPADVRDRAVDIMVVLNAGAARAMVAVEANAATDITGYGLLGHLGEIVRASAVAARVNASSVPLIEGVEPLAAEGLLPGGSRRNRKAIERYTDFGSTAQTNAWLLCDAQTSGGLLIAVPADRLDELVSLLEAEETPTAAVIGEIVEGDGTIQVV